MRRCLFLALCAAFALFAAPSVLFAQEKQPTPTQLEFFEKTVRPILFNHCVECHGPDKQKASLRLDSRPAMMDGGDGGKVVVSGQPNASPLVKAIHYQGETKMPPKSKLKDVEIAALTEWIAQGAPWPNTNTTANLRPAEKGFKISAQDRAFWSFQPIANPAIPSVKNKQWAKSTLDHFLLAKLEEGKLQPAASADRRTLIRRATFDLTGLPPTPDEVEAFEKDTSPDAFAKVVDRLLASPHYGERWARHWLDVARYAEDQAHTFEARRYPQGFRYRDWLIKVFNQDMPYDRFLKEQLAADLLSEPNRVENLPALGFSSLGPVYYGDGKKLDQIDDRIDTVTRGLMGLTVACARCHDHKYDPISTKNYYSLAGVFASTDYVELTLEPGKEGQPLTPPAKGKDKDKDKKAAPKSVPFMHALKEGKVTTMKVLLRGNANTPGEDAPRGFLTILQSPGEGAFKQGSGRLELANAIASKNNPLTARVMVNRVWAYHFGKGLVRTPSNFGQLGERPTHPELLDHLATKFIESGWSLKKLHREIMLSAAYQMSSRHDSAAFQVDPENKLVWRQNRQRLEVEAWRDAMLAAAGTLDRTLGGPSLDLNNVDNRRRTLYGQVSRHELNSLLRLFDFPDPNITSEKRTITTVPLQQLFVLNSEFMVRNSKALSAKLASASMSDAERVRQAYLTLYGRPATERELSLGVGFLSAPNPTGANLSRWDQYAQALLASNEFLYVD